MLLNISETLVLIDDIDVVNQFQLNLCVFQHSVP